MFVERPDERFRARMNARHEQMTIRALTMIFGLTPYAAERAVANLMDNLPEHLRDHAGHEDPASLAARLAGKSPTDLLKARYVSRLKKYDEEVRPEFERAALDDYNKHVKPKYDKQRYG